MAVSTFDLNGGVVSHLSAAARWPKQDKRGYPAMHGWPAPVLIRMNAIDTSSMNDDPGVPTMANTKDEILTWLEGYGTTGVDGLSKSELIDLVTDLLDHP